MTGSRAARRPGPTCADIRSQLPLPPGDGSPLALPDAVRRHVEVCASCRAAVADDLLTAVALRRSFAAARAATPPPDAWPRLRERLRAGRARQTPRVVASPIFGLILSVGFVVAIVVPTWTAQPARPLIDTAAGGSTPEVEQHPAPVAHPSPRHVDPAPEPVVDTDFADLTLDIPARYGEPPETDPAPRTPLGHVFAAV